MRHRRKINHLSRKSAHRKSMLANMASSLILHKRIHTTVAKAKALRVYIEPLLTKSKEDNTHSRRVVFSYLQNKDAVTELFREVSVKIAERPGGYTRIIKTGARLGDNAEMCMMELVDYNENLLGAKEGEKGKSTRRRRRGAGKKTAEAPQESKPQETKAEKPAEEAPVAEPETEEVKDEATAEAQVEEKAEAQASEPEAKSEPAEKVESEAKPDAPAEKAEEKKAEAPKAETKAEPEAKKEEKPAEEKNEDEASGEEDQEKNDDTKK